MSPRLMGTSLEPPLLLQMRCKSVPVSWVGQEPSPTSSRGFSLEDAQHWLLLGQFSFQDPTLCTSQRHQACVPLAHTCPSPCGSVHIVQAAPAGHKDTTCTKTDQNLDSFLGIFLLLAPAAQRQGLTELLQSTNDQPDESRLKLSIP